MAEGPGKYDDLCTYVREQAGVGTTGGVVVIVVNGKDGSGFAVQTADPKFAAALPDMLEYMARGIREDLS